MNSDIIKNPLISVIVLSYNNFEYYEECFNSILSQSYNNIEIVISDDGSNNFKQEELLTHIATNNKNNIKNVTININEKNLGVVKNYNKAISLSNGDYIFYLAIDDIFYDDMVLEDVVKYFEETGELIFTGYKDVYDSEMNKYIKTLPRENEVGFLKSNNPQLLYEKLCIGSFISGSNTPFSKKLIDKYGYLDEEYYYLEDYPKYLKLTRSGCNISFFNRKLIKYRMGGVTTNGKISDLLRKDLRLATLKECKKYFLDVWQNIDLNNKKIIGWGTGDCCINSLGYLKEKISYLVDSNEKLHGSEVNGIGIYSPKQLLNEKKANVFIFIFSYANYFDISCELEKMGFEEKENFFCCTPNILEIVNK